MLSWLSAVALMRKCAAIATKYLRRLASLRADAAEQIQHAKREAVAS
jgi:hypothetical protein